MSAKCSATTKSGSPCKRNAVDKSNFCKQHASSKSSVAPAVKAASATVQSESAKIEEALGQIKNRVEEIKSDSEKFSPANFSPENYTSGLKKILAISTLPLSTKYRQN